jgi:putative transposase
MLNAKGMRFPIDLILACIRCGIELMHMMRKGQFMMEGCDSMSFAGQFYTLVGQVHPK